MKLHLREQHPCAQYHGKVQPINGHRVQIRKIWESAPVQSTKERCSQPTAAEYESENFGKAPLCKVPRKGAANRRPPSTNPPPSLETNSIASLVCHYKVSTDKKYSGFGRRQGHRHGHQMQLASPSSSQSTSKTSADVNVTASANVNRQC